MTGSARPVHHARHGFLGLAGLLLLASAAPAEEPARAAPAWQKEAAASGVKMDVRIVPLDRAGGLTEGELVRFEVGIQDAGTGTPLARLYPAAWMDRRTAATGDKAESCDDKLKMLLGGNLFSRAELDLNVYYVLALNDDATVSVVDPLFGYGGSKLLAMVELRSPGQDWALGPDAGRLFVSMPESDAVAVVETHGWKVTTNIPTGPGPARLALQPDGAWLWVGHDRPDPGQEASGISILQPASLQERARLRTGRGHHEIAFSHDNQLAFVTNRDDGTVSIVDVRKLQVVKTLPAGAAPTSIAWCEAARTAYVSSEDGAITAIDGDRREAVARFQTEPGLGQIRCAPGGRLALAVNPKASLLHVIDTAAQRLAQTGPVGDGPDQISFSDTLAYIRHLRTDEVLMLPLGELGKPGTPLPVIDFPGGEAPPGRAGQPSLAPAIVRAAGASAVLVANPADGVIYYYAEGMAAPMGSFQNYG
ncbi:MAG TPA: cytochrome D1, partial [Thermoanaerobaculia bacterium]|nr:cytochrome D1 [Thermoanaerobaculia bacterium]